MNAIKNHNDNKESKNIPTSVTKIPGGGLHNSFLRHAAVISILMILACFTIGFSAWNFGGGAEEVSVDIDVSFADVEIDGGNVSVLSAEIVEEFSCTPYGIYSADNELTSSNVGTLGYRVELNAAKAKQYNLLDSSYVFSFCATIISNCDILSNASYFLSEQTAIANTGSASYVDVSGSSVSAGTSSSYTPSGSTLYYYTFTVNAKIGSAYLSYYSLPFRLNFKFTGNFYSIVSSVGSLQFCLYLSDADTGGVPS